MKYLSESERNKGIKLVLTVCRNLINNPSQTQKYGNLNAKRIQSKLSQCKPAINLLFIAGFRKSNNSTRLIWTNTNNNARALQNVYDKLKAIDASTATTPNSSKQKPTIVTTQYNMSIPSRWQCKRCTLINDGIFKNCQACNS